MERRRIERRPVCREALIGRNRTPVPKCENARVEDVSREGMRIVSGIPVRQNDALVLYVEGRRKPVRAKVVWVRKEGLIEKRATHRPGQAFVAGCRVIRRQAEPAPDSAPIAERTWLARCLRAAFVLGGLALAGLTGWFLAGLGSMI